MSLTTAKQRFGTYLAEAIQRYPISRIPLSAKMGQDKRKELIFQQKLFLDIAHDFVETKPWVAYFAAVKHFRVLEANEVSTATFNDLRDKEFATQVASAAESLRDSTAPLLDGDTIQHLDELSVLQELSPLIPSARSALSEIETSPHHSAAVAAFKGENPPSGCATVLISFGIMVALCFLFALVSGGSSASSDAPVFFAAGALLVGLFIAYRQFTHWQAVKLLVSRYRTHVVPVAELLRVSPLDWLVQPKQGLATLQDLEARRRQLEQTFLVLDAQ